MTRWKMEMVDNGDGRQTRQRAEGWKPRKDEQMGESIRRARIGSRMRDALLTRDRLDKLGREREGGGGGSGRGDGSRGERAALRVVVSVLELGEQDS